MTLEGAMRTEMRAKAAPSAHHRQVIAAAEPAREGFSAAPADACVESDVIP